MNRDGVVMGGQRADREQESGEERLRVRPLRKGVGEY